MRGGGRGLRQERARSKKQSPTLSCSEGAASSPAGDGASRRPPGGRASDRGRRPAEMMSPFVTVAVEPVRLVEALRHPPAAVLVAANGVDDERPDADVRDGRGGTGRSRCSLLDVHTGVDVRERRHRKIRQQRRDGRREQVGGQASAGSSMPARPQARGADAPTSGTRRRRVTRVRRLAGIWSGFCRFAWTTRTREVPPPLSAYDRMSECRSWPLRGQWSAGVQRSHGGGGRTLMRETWRRGSARARGADRRRRGGSMLVPWCCDGDGGNVSKIDVASWHLRRPAGRLTLQHQDRRQQSRRGPQLWGGSASQRVVEIRTPSTASRGEPSVQIMAVIVKGGDLAKHLLLHAFDRRGLTPPPNNGGQGPQYEPCRSSASNPKEGESPS